MFVLGPDQISLGEKDIKTIEDATRVRDLLAKLLALHATWEGKLDKTQLALISKQLQDLKAKLFNFYTVQELVPWLDAVSNGITAKSKIPSFGSPLKGLGFIDTKEPEAQLHIESLLWHRCFLVCASLAKLRLPKAEAKGYYRLAWLVATRLSNRIPGQVQTHQFVRNQFDQTAHTRAATLCSISISRSKLLLYSWPQRPGMVLACGKLDCSFLFESGVG